jgi:hypothetical protein
MKRLDFLSMFKMTKKEKMSVMNTSAKKLTAIRIRMLLNRSKMKTRLERQ